MPPDKEIACETIRMCLQLFWLHVLIPISNCILSHRSAAVHCGHGNFLRTGRNKTAYN